MKFFLDTEFIENGRLYPIQLISIGVVCEDGREFYAVSSEFDSAYASDWVKANVLTHLGAEAISVSVSDIASGLVSFIGEHSDGGKPEFWGYYADYDWVVFCQMFGTMVDLPKGWPMYCRDLKQWCSSIGNPELPEQASKEHNALFDARWNLQVFNFLKAREVEYLDSFRA